jgi:hypothetical protein
VLYTFSSNTLITRCRILSSLGAGGVGLTVARVVFGWQAAVQLVKDTAPGGCLYAVVNNAGEGHEAR